VLRSTAQGSLDSLSATLFPADCRVCGLPLASFTLLPVCAACWDHLTVQSGPLCACCGEALAFDRTPANETLCRPCRVAPPPFQKAVAWGVYRDELRALLHLLKYDGMHPLSKRLSALLAEPILSIPDLPGELTVVPVPLYGAKRRQRGFNQAELLARGVTSVLRRRRLEMRFSLEPGVLVRQRATQSHSNLTPHQRRENVRGAFSVSRPETIRDRNVLLIDDIYTTGATARACAQALHRAGAASVWVATVARAQKEAWPRQTAAADRMEIPMRDDVAFWNQGGTASLSETSEGVSRR
jgi:ComF family protein